MDHFLCLYRLSGGHRIEEEGNEGNNWCVAMVRQIKSSITDGVLREVARVALAKPSSKRFQHPPTSVGSPNA